MTTQRSTLTLCGLAIALMLPCLGLGQYIPQIGALNPLYAHELFWWALLALMLIFILAVEKRPLISVGLRRPNWKTFVLGIVAGIVTVVGITTIYFVIFLRLGLHMNAGEMAKLLHTPFWFRFLLVTRAALMEETVFRGYGIERLTELTANRWFAGASTWAAFTLAHLSTWGWAQLIIAGWGGLVLTALYLWRRDLACNITAHWIADGAGFLLPR